MWDLLLTKEEKERKKRFKVIDWYEFHKYWEEQCGVHSRSCGKLLKEGRSLVLKYNIKFPLKDAEAKRIFYEMEPREILVFNLYMAVKRCRINEWFYFKVYDTVHWLFKKETEKAAKKYEKELESRRNNEQVS